MLACDHKDHSIKMNHDDKNVHDLIPRLLHPNLHE